MRWRDADVPSEKSTRGLVRSAVDRALAGRRTVVVDSLNNIKGYRYELWCLAKQVRRGACPHLATLTQPCPPPHLPTHPTTRAQAATRYCVVHVDTPAERCREWNEARAQSGAPCYSAAVFDDLAGRFERPDSRNRWDQPLFTVCPPAMHDLDAATAAQLEAAAAALGGDVAAAAAAGGGQRGLGKTLKPNLATDTSSTCLAGATAPAPRAHHAQGRPAGGPRTS